MPDDELITSSEASVLLGTSARTVQRMVDRRDLKPIRQLPGPNGAFLFARSDVAKLREERSEQRDIEAAAS